MSATINVGRPAHLPSTNAEAEVRRVHRVAGTNLSDSAAVTVASWWAGPGTPGKHLAALATSGRVELVGLLDDIARTTAQYHPAPFDLVALRRWAKAKAGPAPHTRRPGDQCDDTCTTDCGHCKGGAAWAQPAIRHVAACGPTNTSD